MTQPLTDQERWPFRATPPAAMLPPGACDCHLHLFGPFDRFPLLRQRLYTPALATVEDAERMLRTLGLTRAVFVQPSAYGSDPACLLDGLERVRERARGVLVLDAAARLGPLRAWHDAGIRGARINVGGPGALFDAGAFMAKARVVAERIAGLGWHLDLHVPLAALDRGELERLATQVPIVLDHLAYVSGDRPQEVELLVALLQTGQVWAKLSGFYRVVTNARSTERRITHALIARLIEEVPERLLWGSDWPHTPPHSDDAGPWFRDVDTGEQLRPLLDYADARTLERILVDNPRALYGFEPISPQPRY